MKGRKRHIVVDTLGMPVAIIITSAGVQDRDGGADVIRSALDRYPTIKKIWADSAYAGECVEKVILLGCDLEIVRRSNEGFIWTGEGDVPPARGFKVVKRRWVVERTFAWIGRCRRLSKDYEHNIESSVAWVLLSLIRLVVRRLGA